MRKAWNALTPLALSMIVAWMGAIHSVQGQSTWVGPAGGSQSWLSAANWDPSTSVPDGVDAEAVFNMNLTSELAVSWETDLTLGKLTLGDTTSTFYRTILGASGQRLIFDVSSGNAVLSLGTPANNIRDQILADLVLDDTLTVRTGNQAGSGLELHGSISGSGGLVRTNLPSVSPASNSSVLKIVGDNNSFTGSTVIETGVVEISGSVLKDQNSALGNANSAIVIGNANSPLSLTQYSTGAGLIVRTTSDSSEWEINRNIDFSKGAESSNTNNWRSVLTFAANGAGGQNTNRLILSGDLIVGGKTPVITAERKGMEVYITGNMETWLPGGRSAQSILYNAIGAGTSADGVAGGTIRFSDRARTYTNSQGLTNGTIVIEGSVGEEGTASPIGTKKIVLSDGNGGNILSSEHGVRSIFMANPDTSYARAIELGTGNSTTPSGAGATYYGATGINVYNGFVVGGQNTSGVVTYSGDIQSNSVNIGTNKRVTLGHNLALISATGGTVDFTGEIQDSSSADYHTRVTINQLRNHSHLDTNADGVLNANANAAIGTATQGTVRLYAANTYEGGTEVMGGSLLVRNAAGSATGTGMILVNTGTKFGGTGAVAPGSKKLELLSGATLTPGDATLNGGIGSLRVTGDVQLSALGGSILDFQFLAANGINDLISSNLVGGELNWDSILSGTMLSDKNDYLEVVGHLGANTSGTTLVNFSLADEGLLEAGMAWNLWDSTSTSSLTEDHFTFNFNGLDTVLAGQGLAFDTSRFADFGILAVTAVVPEPSRMLLLGVSIALITLRRRRA